MTDEMLALVALEREDLPSLDAGELHMMAWLHANPTEAVLTALSTADRAAVKATFVLELLERVTSLQELARTAGVGRNQLKKLHDHFLEDWLGKVRMQLNSGIM